MEANRHFIAHTEVQRKVLLDLPIVLEVTSVVTVANLNVGNGQRGKGHLIGRSQQEAGERMSGGASGGRQRCLSALKQELTIRASRVRGHRSEPPNVPAHPKFMLASQPTDVLADVGCPVKLIAVVHFAVLYAPRCQGISRSKIDAWRGVSGHFQADLRSKASLRGVVPKLLRPAEAKRRVDHHVGAQNPVVIDAKVLRLIRVGAQPLSQWSGQRSGEGGVNFLQRVEVREAVVRRERMIQLQAPNVVHYLLLH